MYILGIASPRGEVCLNKHIGKKIASLDKLQNNIIREALQFDFVVSSEVSWISKTPDSNKLAQPHRSSFRSELYSEPSSKLYIFSRLIDRDVEITDELQSAEIDVVEVDTPPGIPNVVPRD